VRAITNIPSRDASARKKKEIQLSNQTGESCYGRRCQGNQLGRLFVGRSRRATTKKKPGGRSLRPGMHPPKGSAGKSGMGKFKNTSSGLSSKLRNLGVPASGKKKKNVRAPGSASAHMVAVEGGVAERPLKRPEPKRKPGGGKSGRRQGKERTTHNQTQNPPRPWKMQRGRRPRLRLRCLQTLA